jgi:hypothetical protein
MPTLGIGPERVDFVVLEERELDQGGRNGGTTDPTRATMGWRRFLEGYDTIRSSSGYLPALNNDELEDLLALTWLGRGSSDLRPGPRLPGR